MPYGRPLDTSSSDWYKAAKTIDQNREANEAFQLASHPTPHPAPCSTLISLVKTNPLLVNTDVGLKKNPPPPTCYRCHKTRHKAPNCPDKYDIRMSSVEELEMEIMVRRDVMKPGIGEGFYTRQRVKGTPSLSTSNRFKILSNICDSETILPDMQKPEKQIPVPITAQKIQKSKWEKALPKKYFIATMEQSLMSLKLKVEIETIDTLEQRSLTCLVDSGATSEFIDQDYAKSCHFNLVKLKQPILVYNVDGTLNEAGSITEVVHLILHHKNHSERTVFAITSLGKQKLLLRHSWIQNHNPEIDWVKGEVKMSRCPPHCCSGCQDERG